MLLSLKTISLSKCLFPSGTTVLFQGDSITDMGRGRTADPNHLLGHGYACLISAREGADFPDSQTLFINRGVSGNTVNDLVTRWKEDTLAQKPDVLSILIGVNDVFHKLREKRHFSADEFEHSYDQLLRNTVTVLPHVKLILCEPFFAPGIHTSDMEQWQVAMKSVQGVVGKLASKYYAPVVHYQKLFNAAIKRAPVSYWIWDGIHPTYSGHQLMADEWTRTFRDFYGDSVRNKSTFTVTSTEAAYQ